MSSDATHVRDSSPRDSVKAHAQDVPSGYKRTDVGVIPEDWEVRLLSEHFRIYAGGDVPKHSLSQTQSASHPYPVFANALQNHGLYGFTNERRSRKDSLTITARGFLGHAEYRDEPFFPIVRLLVLEPIGQLNARFSTYAVNDRVKFAFESTGVPQLTAPQVGKYSIASPQPPEQRAIAEALSDVDELLGALEALIAKKRAIKQAAKQQLLTGKTRLPGFSGEWVTKRLGEIGYFLKGNGIKRDDAQSGPLPCVRYGEIYTTHHDYVRKFTSWISPEVAATATRLERGDLLFAGSGETKEEIGKCVAFVFEGEAYAGGDIVILRPSNANSVFLGYAMNMPDAARQKASLGQGDAVVHISAAALGQVKLSIPLEAEQFAIAAVLSDMDAEIAALEAHRDKTHAIKEGMMQQLLTGRVRLAKPEAEPAC